MEITKNTVVTLDYTVKDPEGSLIDDGHHPLVYLHGGYDGIFAVIEEALQAALYDLYSKVEAKNSGGITELERLRD